MDPQSMFNIAVALIGALGGWVLNSLTKSIEDLRQSDHAVRNKVQTIELTLAGKYVSREDLDRMTNAIFIKLDRIDAKLDSKQDKPTH